MENNSYNKIYELVIKYDADEIKINNENSQDCFIIGTRKKNRVYFYTQPIKAAEFLNLFWSFINF